MAGKGFLSYCRGEHGRGKFRPMLAAGFDIGADSIAFSCIASSGRIKLCRTVLRSKVRTIKGVRARVYTDTYHAELARLARAFAKYGVAVFVEQSYVGFGRRSNVKVFRVLAHVESEIKFELARHGVAVTFITASEWQSAILNKTRPRDLLERLSIKAAKQYAKQNGADESASTVHEADAVNIARHGLDLLRDVKKETKRCRKSTTK